MLGRQKTPPSGGGPIVDELGQSYGHLRLAAGHAATEVAAAIGRLRSTTITAISPLYDQIHVGVRKETRMTKRKNRWGLVGLLAAGAALGAVGAMFARRRRATSAWNQYAPGVDDIGFADMHSESSGRLAATTKKVADRAAAVAETVSAQAGRIAETLHERTAGSSGDSGPTATTQVFSSPPSGAASPEASASSTSASPSASPASGSSGDPTPGATDEAARALAGRTSRRGPFSAFANSDET